MDVLFWFVIQYFGLIEFGYTLYIVWWFGLCCESKICSQRIPPDRCAPATNQGVTVDTAGSSEDGFTFNDVLSMLVFDIVLYSFLAWYLGNVSHGGPNRDCHRLKIRKKTVASVPCRAINPQGV